MTEVELAAIEARANAETAEPRLIAEVRRLRAALERVRDHGMTTARIVYDQEPGRPEEIQPFCNDCCASGEPGAPFAHAPDSGCGIAQAALGEHEGGTA